MKDAKKYELLKQDIENFKENVYYMVNIINILSYCICEYLDGNTGFIDLNEQKTTCSLYGLSIVVRKKADELEEQINILAGKCNEI